MEIDGCFVGLRHLLIARNIVDSPILTEVCSRLLEIERNIGFDALLTNAKHPFVIADTGITARFSANSHLFNPTAEISSEVDVF